MVHALANSKGEVPLIDVQDVEFGRVLILHFFENFKIAIKGLIFDSPLEKDKAQLVMAIADAGLMNRKELILATPSFSKKKRELLIEELLDSEQIFIASVKNEDGSSNTQYGVIND